MQFYFLIQIQKIWTIYDSFIALESFGKVEQNKKKINSKRIKKALKKNT